MDLSINKKQKKKKKKKIHFIKHSIGCYYVCYDKGWADGGWEKKNKKDKKDKKDQAQRGGRTRNLEIKSLTLCRLS